MPSEMMAFLYNEFNIFKIYLVVVCFVNYRIYLIWGTIEITLRK